MARGYKMPTPLAQSIGFILVVGPVTVSLAVSVPAKPHFITAFCVLICSFFGGVSTLAEFFKKKKLVVLSRLSPLQTFPPVHRQTSCFLSHTSVAGCVKAPPNSSVSCNVLSRGVRCAVASRWKDMAGSGRHL
ncbi:hypothetical protein FKM82_027851 [Ascaphus truei]